MIVIVVIAVFAASFLTSEVFGREAVIQSVILLSSLASEFPAFLKPREKRTQSAFWKVRSLEKNKTQLPVFVTELSYRPLHALY